MDTGQSPSVTLQYQQSQPPPGFPPPSSGPSKYGAFSGPQQQAPIISSSTTAAAANLAAAAAAVRPARVYSPQEVPANIKAARSSVEYGLGQLRSLQLRRYRSDEVGAEERLRILAASVLGDLRALRGEVTDVLRAAERHRWRKWLLGGVVDSSTRMAKPDSHSRLTLKTQSAALIPVVRAFWRRPRHDNPSSSNTEYAFMKSKSLIRRILSSVRTGFGGLATVTFFVFAVLYVFQNEVVLRVAKTMSKRLRRLSSKIERGEDELSEADMKLLKGWRWRVLLWDH